MPSAGETFRLARQRQSLTLEEVAQRTKIRSRVLEAMEVDKFDILPPVYMTGFVRTYARLLHINNLPEIQGINHGVNGTNEHINEIHHTDDDWQHIFAPHLESSGVINGEDLIHSFNLSQRRRALHNPALKYIYGLAAALIIVVGYLLAFGLPFKRNDTPIFAVQPKPVKIQAETPNDNTNLNIVQSLRQDSATLQSPNPSDSLIVEAQAVETAWVNLVIDKKRNEQMTLETGKSYRWSAEKIMTLSLGNAGGVRFRVNGRHIEPLGKSGAVVRDIRITPEGITSSSLPIIAKNLTQQSQNSPLTSGAPTNPPLTTPDKNTPQKSLSPASTNNTAKPAGESTSVNKARVITRAKNQQKLIEPASRPVHAPDIKPPSMPKPKVTLNPPPADTKRN